MIGSRDNGDGREVIASIRIIEQPSFEDLHFNFVWLRNERTQLILADYVYTAAIVVWIASALYISNGRWHSLLSDCVCRRVRCDLFSPNTKSSSRNQMDFRSEWMTILSHGHLCLRTCARYVPTAIPSWVRMFREKFKRKHRNRRVIWVPASISNFDVHHKMVARMATPYIGNTEHETIFAENIQNCWAKWSKWKCSARCKRK